jgi:predicted transcriptional regulator
MKSITISFRLPSDVIAKLDARAAEEGRDRTAILRASLDAYLEAPLRTVEQRLQSIEREIALLRLK